MRVVLSALMALGMAWVAYEAVGVGGAMTTEGVGVLGMGGRGVATGAAGVECGSGVSRLGRLMLAMEQGAEELRVRAR